MTKPAILALGQANTLISLMGMHSGLVVARGRGLILTQVVSLSKIHLHPKSTGNTQEAVAPSRHY